MSQIGENAYFWKQSRVLLCRGHRDLLAAMRATSHPAWAALSTSGLGTLDLPKETMPGRIGYDEQRFFSSVNKAIRGPALCCLSDARRERGHRFSGRLSRELRALSAKSAYARQQPAFGTR